MYLKRLIVSNFKNIGSADLTFSPNINCIYGDNGEGKTNLLDAVNYLSMTKSFLQTSDRFTYTYGQDEAALCGFYQREDYEDKIAVSVKQGGEKTVKKNDKTYQKISDHIGHIPIVVISPSDTSLIHDSGEERRRFMNMVLSQTDPLYLRAIQSYNRVLQQRNKILKGDTAVPKILLEAFSAQLNRDASYIYSCRGKLAQELDSLTGEFYKQLSDGKESVSLRYTSDLHKGSMAELLDSSYDRDTVLKYTSVGIQRDDYEFLMNDYPLKKCASQGQQKSFLISLKLAQLEMMKQQRGFSPILLLDDLFDKLDMKRVECLINMVSQEGFGQLFITDSNKVRVSELVRKIDSQSRFYSVTGGKFTELE